MKRQWTMALLTVLCGTSVWAIPALAGLAPGTVIRREVRVIPPGDFKAVALSESIVLLTWRPPRPLLDHLSIRPQVQATGGGLSEWKILPGIGIPPDSTRFEHRGLTPFTMYQYRVCGYVFHEEAKAEGKEPWEPYCSDSVSVQTLRGPDMKVLKVPPHRGLTK